jgi:hypothetical protein
LLWRIYIAFDNDPFWLYPAFWFLAPLITALVANRTYDLLHHAAPALLDLSLGKRATTKPEAASAPMYS